MKKKILIPIFVILVLAVAGGGFFWWWQGREIKGSPQDYIIKETEEGKFVENKRAGLTMKVPEDWIAEKIEVEEGLMIFYSPNIEGRLEGDRIVPPLDKGCIIHTSLTYEEMDFVQLKQEARYGLALLGVVSAELEEVTINDYHALKTTSETQKIGHSIGIDIPHKNKTYSFLLIFVPYDEETCVQEFDKFLETILIK